MGTARTASRSSSCRDRTEAPIHYTAYGDESDPGPFPIPPNAPVEGGADARRSPRARRAAGTCHLYELGRAFWRGDHWDATVGVNWDLRSNALRPLDVDVGRRRRTADPAGTRSLRRSRGRAINHALRFTVSRLSNAGYILPATHYASSNTDPNLPPMGLAPAAEGRASTSRTFTGQSRVILEALKKYGMIVADNGSSWFITGAADPRWNDDDLNQLKTVPGSAFEAVDTGPVHS